MSAEAVSTRPALAGLSRQTWLGLLALAGATLLALYLRARLPSLALIWIFGLAFGFVLQRGRFCFASAFRDLFLLRDGRVMKGILAGLAVATPGFALVMYTYAPTIVAGRFPAGAPVFPLGPHTLIAGAIFGIGMVVAGGCVSGNLYRMGEGYLASWVAVIGMMVGLSFAAYTWNWWWRTVMEGTPQVWLPQSLGWGGAVVLTMLAIAAAYLAVLWWESRGGLVSPRREAAPPAPEGVSGRLAEMGRGLFRRPLPVITAGVVLGLLNVFLYLFSRPWGVAGEVWRWGEWFATRLGGAYPQLLGMEAVEGCHVGGAATHGLFTWGLLINGGIIAGSLVGALMAGEFKWRVPRQRRRFAQSLGGGVLLGYGAGLGLGCTIGAFFSAVPALALNGWVFALGLALGALVGIQIIRRL
ncbi:MAG: YeeE/YedE family protein [Chloroflexi bacterium]|nr:YeeE/YedE family protein [Chloroflexota bacterium]